MRAIVILPISLYNTSASFVPCINRSRLTTSYKRHTTIIKIDTSEDNASSDIDATTNDSNQRKNTVARAGGRRREPKPPHIYTKKDTIFSFLRRWTLPLILLFVIFRLLSGIILFGGSTPNVVYYSSSYYSSTTYNKDGNVETTRKSEFKSNIPNLVEKSKEYSQSQQEERNYRDDSVTIDIRDELEDEINSFLYQKW